MKKSILEFRASSASVFFRFMQKVAQAKSWQIDFLSEPHFESEKLAPVSAALVDVSLSSNVIKTLSVLPTLCRNIGAVDSFFKENESFYARLISYEALQSLLIDEAPQWDNRQPVFVVGNSELAKIAAGAVAALGAQRVYLVGDPQILRSYVQTLQRFQLGIRFEVIPADELTSMEVSGGLLINTVDLNKDKDLLVALSYFNFLNPGSFVMDVLIHDLGHELLDEARKAGFSVISCGRFAAHWSSHWFRKYFADDQVLSPEESEKIWNEFLRENSSSV